jgi:hypothetical protein
MAVYTQMGCDPIVGRRLVELLYAAGAAPSRNTWIFFGSCAGNRDFEAYIDNIMGVLQGAKERILDFRLLDTATWERVTAALSEWKQRPDAAMWFAMAWAEGVRQA